MGHLKGLAFVIVGVMLAILGLGMWQSPEINWEGFLGAWSTVGNGIMHLKDDPFALLGTAVLAVGLIMAYYGVKRLVRG